MPALVLAYVPHAASGGSPGASDVFPALITAALALTTAVFGCLAWTVRWAWRIVKRFIRLLDDFLGEPARDGLEARPGVMARLASVETIVAQVHAETRPNHGSSLRDVVNRVEQEVNAIKTEQVAVKARLDSYDAGRPRR